MDKLSKILIGLTVITGLLMMVGDIAYAKYRATGHRYSSTISTQQVT